jgi:coproporphyrinogen III oxidase
VTRLLSLLGIEPDTPEADRWTCLPADLQDEIARALEALQRHGELRLVRSHWCHQEGDGWCEVCSPETGLWLAREGAVVVSGMRMLPRPRLRGDG